MNTFILASSVPVTVLPRALHHVAPISLQWEAWLPLVLLGALLLAGSILSWMRVDLRVVQAGLCAGLVLGAAIFGAGLHQALGPGGAAIFYAGNFLLDDTLALGGGLLVFLLGAGLVAVVPLEEAAAAPRMILPAICTLLVAITVAAGTLLTILATLPVIYSLMFVAPLLPKGRTGAGTAAAERFRYSQLVFILLLLGLVLLSAASPAEVFPQHGTPPSAATIYVLPAVLGMCLFIAASVALLAGWMAVAHGHLRAGRAVSAMEPTLGLVVAGITALLLLSPLIAARPELAIILLATGMLLLLSGVTIAVLQQRVGAALPALAIAQYGLILLAIACSPAGTAAADAAVALACEGGVALLVLAVASEAGDRAGLAGPEGAVRLGMLVAGFSLAGIPVAFGFLARIGLAQTLVASGTGWALVPLFGAMAVIGFWFLVRTGQRYWNPVQAQTGRMPGWRSPVGIVVLLGCLALVVPFFSAPSLSGVLSSMASVSAHPVGSSQKASR